MSAIDVLNQPAAQAIGWALVHFVWQGALIALVTGAVLAALRRSDADVRYVVATIGLALMLTMPAVTATQSWRSSVDDRVVAASAPTTDGASIGARETIPMPAAPDSQTSAAVASGSRVASGDERITGIAALIRQVRVEPWLPALLFVWLCGVAVLTLRLVSGWLWVQRMKSHNAVPAGDGWQQMATRLSRRLHISRTIRLLESAAVEVPTVIGWMKPVVLLPASALAGLSTTQLEAILAHELAHIRRHDYLVNLMQTLVETLLFYHPAVWWLSRRIRIERENCCDDLAVSLCGDPYTYAAALADLEELRGSRHALAIAASGGSLLHRVRRLLGAPTTHTGRAPGWLAGATAVLLMLGIAAGAVGHDALLSAADAEALAQTVPAATAPVAIEPAAIAATVAVAAPTAPVATTSVAVAPAATAAAASGGEQNVHISRDDGRRRGNFVWSSNGQKLEIRYEGEIQFTEDDRDVKSISPGGYLKVSDGGWIGGRGVEFRADASGSITRRYRVGIIEKPFEPEGRAWLSQSLPRFIRQTGLGAAARVDRILRSQGPAGVLSEISRIEGGWAKRVYFSELLKSGRLDAAGVRQALVQAGREMNSDYELASLLISSQHLITDEATRRAYFDAAAHIRSDYELRRVLSAGLKGGPVSSAILNSILAAAATIESDYELASLLIQVTKLQPIEAPSQRAYFVALESIASPYEHGRALSALADRRNLDDDLLVQMLQSGARIRSDYEQAQFLLRIARQRPIDGKLRLPFFAAVEGMKSSYERSRVLLEVTKHPNTPPDTILSVIRAAKTTSSSYERSQVLLAVAARHPLYGQARDAYIDAAEGLGDYEQGRVLTALVKNERAR